MRYQHRLLLAALLGLALGSCKKEEEKRAPVVTIVTPGNGFDLSVPDTLNVVVDVSGEDAIDNVSFRVTDANGIPLGAALTAVPTSNPARVEVDIPVTSESIVSGDYTLTVQANSGDAQGKDYAALDILGAPLRLRRVLVVGQPDGGTVSIHIIDSTGAVSLANTLLMDLGGAAISSAAQVMGVMGTVQGPLLALRPDGVQVPWQKPNLGNSGIPWFTSLDVAEDGRMYAGTTDGYLRGYNAGTGATEFVASLSSGYRPLRVQVVHDRMVIAEVDQTGSVYRLGVYQAFSGALIADQFLDKEVVGIHRRDDTHVLLFGNRNGQGVVEDRDVQAGGGWEPRTWASPITAVEQVDANTFLVALEDGSLERFTYSNAGSLTIGTIANVRDLALDPVSGLVYAAAGMDVLAINPQSGQVTSSYPIGTTVRYVLPLLNR